MLASRALMPKFSSCSYGALLAALAIVPPVVACGGGQSVGYLGITQFQKPGAVRDWATTLRDGARTFASDPMAT